MINCEKVYDVVNKHSIQLAKVEERIEGLEKHIDNRFDHFDLYFKESDKNSTFRKNTYSALRIIVVLVPCLGFIGLVF